MYREHCRTFTYVTKAFSEPIVYMYIKLHYPISSKLLVKYKVCTRIDPSGMFYTLQVLRNDTSL